MCSDGLQNLGEGRVGKPVLEDRKERNVDWSLAKGRVRGGL